jgi:hypothetical protein
VALQRGPPAVFLARSDDIQLVDIGTTLLPPALLGFGVEA